MANKENQKKFLREMRTPLDSLCSRIRGGEAKSDVGGSKRRPLDTSDSGEREGRLGSELEVQEAEYAVV